MTRKKVLIADDDRQLVEVIALRASRLGLDVATAYNAIAALQISHDLRPDLVILDVNMPAGNGLSVCEMLATNPDSSRIPVIILTGRKDPETIRRCHDMMAYYVQKCPDVWLRIEPVIYELLDIEPIQAPSLASGR